MPGVSQLVPRWPDQAVHPGSSGGAPQSPAPRGSWGSPPGQSPGPPQAAGGPGRWGCPAPSGAGSGFCFSQAVRGTALPLPASSCPCGAQPPEPSRSRGGGRAAGRGGARRGAGRRPCGRRCPPSRAHRRGAPSPARPCGQWRRRQQPLFRGKLANKGLGALAEPACGLPGAPAPGNFATASPGPCQLHGLAAGHRRRLLSLQPLPSPR